MSDAAIETVIHAGSSWTARPLAPALALDFARVQAMGGAPSPSRLARTHSTA